MLDTSARLLRLLTTLQTRRHWSGTELAERLGITARTLRRDVDRLRALGYGVEAASGPGGGYQLGTGTTLPPLLLADEEAVAVAAALRSAMETFTGVSDTVPAVLVKLEQLLPRRLRRRVGALQAMTISVGSRPRLDAEVLLALAAACRDGVELGFHYTRHDGADAVRRVEPLRLAHTGNRRWYLVAWDLDSAGWRTFRVDRLRTPSPGPRFVPRAPPPDLEHTIAESISAAPYLHRARLRLHGSAREMAARVPPWIGAIEAVDDDTCILSVGADTPTSLVSYITMAGVDFELLEPADLAPVLRDAGRRLSAGAASTRERASKPTVPRRGRQAAPTARRREPMRR
jgi:predicted DNA-binding transcriptional regulator YafY